MKRYFKTTIYILLTSLLAALPLPVFGQSLGTVDVEGGTPLSVILTWGPTPDPFLLPGEQLSLEMTLFEPGGSFVGREICSSPLPSLTSASGGVFTSPEVAGYSRSPEEYLNPNPPSGTYVVVVEACFRLFISHFPTLPDLTARFDVFSGGKLVGTFNPILFPQPYEGFQHFLIQVAQASPHLSLTVDHSTIEPSGLQASSISNLITVTATLTDQNGQSIPGKSIDFQPSVADMTVAGHVHTNFTASLPGTFVDDTGLQTTSCITDQAGQCHVNYVVPVVSGRFNLIASFQSVSALPQFVNVQVGGLVALGAGIGFDSTRPDGGGQTAAHPVNHFGTPLLTGVIIPALAADYSLLTRGTLGINDMALPLGGLFDLDRLWDGAGGHNLHRSGMSVDINRRQVDGQTINQRTLDALARAHGLMRITETRCLSTSPFTPCIHYEVLP